MTDLPPGGTVRGFDTGPGNVLSDLWHAQHRDGPFDARRRVGGVRPADRDAARRDAAPTRTSRRSRRRAPAATGSTRRWLDEHLARSAPGAAPPDVQATLVALTARTIADAVRASCAAMREVLVCGGGARNATLMRALERELAPRRVAPTSARGVAVDHVEALAFAWLARETLAGRPGNLPAVTGARGPRVLGAIYRR